MKMRIVFALATTVAALSFAGTAVALPSCRPFQPAAKPITIEALKPHALTVSWEVVQTPIREWLFYYNANLEEPAKNEYKPAQLQNGTARSFELTMLKSSTTYKVMLGLEYPTCIEDELVPGNDLGSGTTL